jgi:RimJ/RimL family protein N-acetyltransferase
VRITLDRKLGETELASDGDVLSLAIEREGDLIGDCVLWLGSIAHAQGEVGYIVDPAYQGHGYASEAAAALIDLAFREVGLHRVVGRIEPRNAASGRVLENAGMRREALFVENELIKGEWQSEAVYAILRREWAERRRNGALR